jgi:hypothetical protein
VAVLLIQKVLFCSVSMFFHKQISRDSWEKISGLFFQHQWRAAANEAKN